MRTKWGMLLVLLLVMGGLAARAEPDAPDRPYGLPFGDTFERCDRWARRMLGSALPEPVDINGWQVSTLPEPPGDVFGTPMRCRFVFDDGKLLQFVAERVEDDSCVQALHRYLRVLAAVERRVGAPKDVSVLRGDGVWLVTYFKDCMVVLVRGQASGVYVFVQPGLTAEMGIAA